MFGASQVPQWVKNLPAMQEMHADVSLIPRLGGGMGTHFSIPAWRIPLTEEPGRL